jgi:alpha-beta hydrolase superfamily lysophospholipase
MNAGIPVIVVVGVADDVILESDNTALLEKRYREAAKEITIIRKPGCGHHPHSLEDPRPIVEFLLRNTIAGRKS